MQVTTDIRGNVAVLHVQGEVDTLSAPELEAALASGLRGRSAVVDMGDVTFLDSTGLRVLLDARLRAEAAGATVTVRAPSPFVQRLLAITGLEDMIE